MSDDRDLAEAIRAEIVRKRAMSGLGEIGRNDPMPPGPFRVGLTRLDADETTLITNEGYPGPGLVLP